MVIKVSFGSLNYHHRARSTEPRYRPSGSHLVFLSPTCALVRVRDCSRLCCEKMMKGVEICFTSMDF